MENLPTFVLHSTKKRSIWRFLLLAGCVSSCSYGEPLQQLWAGAPSQLWPHLPPHNRGVFLLLEGSFNILVSCSLSSSGCSSSCGQARPFAGAWPHLSLLLQGDAGDPRKCPWGQRGCSWQMVPVHLGPSMCHEGLQPSRTEMESTAVEGRHCWIWTAGSIHGPWLFPPSPLSINLLPFSAFFPFLSCFPSFGFAFNFIFSFSCSLLISFSS